MTAKEDTQVFKLLGKIDGKIDSLQQRIDRVEGNIDLMRESQQDVAIRITEISTECPRHAKRISTLEKKFEYFQTTGTLHISEMRSAWKTIGVISSILVTAIMIAATIFGIVKGVILWK
jgi:predicted RNase H-like nuclease (RuvC/YqgF family)